MCVCGGGYVSGNIKNEFQKERGGGGRGGEEIFILNIYILTERGEGKRIG